MKPKQKHQWEIVGITKKQWLMREQFDPSGHLCPECGDETMELAEEISDECFHVWRECPCCDWLGDHYDC